MISELDYRELVKYREPHAPADEDHSRFIMLRDRHFLEIYSWKMISVDGFDNVKTTDKWVISELGKDALYEFEKEREQQAKHERQQRFQNKISILNILVPFVTFFLGLVIEHYAGLLSWVASLFHS